MLASITNLMQSIADTYQSVTPDWLEKFTPVVLLLIVVAFVFYRLPTVDVGHDKGFKRRRIMNWLPLGLTYAFLYMGRYNLTVSKSAFENLAGGGNGSMMGNEAFGVIFGVGTIVYGFSFLINGPLTDKLGGRFAILIGAAGAILANLLMGLASLSLLHSGPLSGFLVANFVIVFSILYAMNMYFQSFGAVAIVKVNSSWFHVRERGVFGAIFGILISLGIYFAFDLGSMILDSMGLAWVFLMPALLLTLFWVIDYFIVFNKPSEAGQEDFNTADATSGDEGPQLSAIKVFKMMLTNPIIITIALIEFCSGFLRQAIMQWGKIFPKQTGIADSFVPENWGMLLCCAGILGGMFAGVISDHVFQSRRGPVAAVLYGGMLAGSVGMYFLLGNVMLMWLLIFMSLCVIGVHGMLSGTASMDFGGAKNAGIAVGIIDGFVYLGTAVMSFWYGWRLPQGKEAKDPSNWGEWPLWMIPLAVIGLVLAAKLWNAKPKPKKQAEAAAD